jgi:hypothetical protein
MRDRSEVAKMTEKMKTVCVGRYLMDVPAQAEVSLSHGMIGGFEIDIANESEAEFRDRVAAREADVSVRNPAADGNGGLVEARDLRIPGMVGRTLIFARSRGYLMEGNRRVDMESVSVEAHAHTAGVSFSLSAQSTDEASAAEAEALLGRLRLRDKDEIPTVPGFCIERAVFVEPLPPHTNEHMAMHLSLPAHPDLALAFLSVAGGKPGPGLLARVANIDAATEADELLRVTKLRTGRRSVNGIDGEEVLERAMERNFATTYGFNWEARGAHHDLMQPYLSLELHAGISERPGGKPVDSSLHEDAVLVLWDSIASSIRLRPKGPPPPSAPPSGPKGPRLGTMANAGDVCPQSGWWRCSEGGPGLDVHGGQVQYMRQGERMPQALLLPKQTLWQKVRRIQPSMESPRLTAWKLIDKRMRRRAAPAVGLAQAGVPAAGSALGAGNARAPVVGTYVRTGEPCPASGWWRCEEPHALDGTRWFALGSLLPPATFQVPPGVFGKSAGPEVIQRRSVWQLVRPAETAEVVQAKAQPQRDVGLPIGEPPALV